jgi:hypothetical protein
LTKRNEIDLTLDGNFRIPELHRSSNIRLRVTTLLTALWPSVLGAEIGGLLGTITWAEAISAVLTVGFVVASIVMGVVANAQQGHERTTSQLENAQLVNTKQSAQPMRVVYGIMKVGGNWVFSRASPANINILNFVITWCEGEIAGLAPA